MHRKPKEKKGAREKDFRRYWFIRPYGNEYDPTSFFGQLFLASFVSKHLLETEHRMVIRKLVSVESHSVTSTLNVPIWS